MKRKALGKGLGALIPELERPEGDQIQLDLDLISPNPDQPRFRLDESKLEELASSIRENGVLQPILVRPLANRYQLVAGERRLAAAQRAGLLKIPAIIREIPDDKMLELALIENIQREELNPIEEAQAYQSMVDSLHLTQEELASRVSKDRATVANSLRLLRLPQGVKLLVVEGKLSPGHARALLGADLGAMEMERIANLIVQKDWSVRETERWAKNRTRGSHARRAQDPDVEAAADKLRVQLGTKVEIVTSRSADRAGRIQIYFYSGEDLDRIYGLLIDQHT